MKRDDPRYFKTRYARLRKESRCTRCMAKVKSGCLCRSCRKKSAKANKQTNDSLRAKVYTAYGNKCSCCGESEKLFLTIEHLNGDGAEHRRKVGHAWSVLRDIVKTKFPKKYTILCSNCNIGKYRNKGICPHKEK